MLEVEQVEAGDALHAAAVVFVVLHHALVAEDAVGLDGGKCFGKQSPQFVDPVFTHVPRVACERHRSVGRGEDHPSARPQHTGDFTHERCVVVDVFDHLEGNDEIERFVPEAERRHAHPSEFDVGCVAVSGGGVFVHRDETVAMRRDEFDAVSRSCPDLQHIARYDLCRAVVGQQRPLEDEVVGCVARYALGGCEFAHIATVSSV